MSIQSSTKTDSPKRGRGRPASFPNVETVFFPVTLPTEARDMVREISRKRGENINVTMFRFIQNGFKAATRKRK